MTKISRIPLRDEELDRLMRDFWKALASLRTAKEIETLLAGFLTHTEVKMFTKRLEIAKMLLGGDSYSVISHALKVTDVPIARINNLLHDNRKFQKMIRSL